MVEEDGTKEEVRKTIKLLKNGKAEGERGGGQWR